MCVNRFKHAIRSCNAREGWSHEQHRLHRRRNRHYRRCPVFSRTALRHHVLEVTQDSVAPRRRFQFRLAAPAATPCAIRGASTRCRSRRAAAPCCVLVMPHGRCGHPRHDRLDVREVGNAPRSPTALFTEPGKTCMVPARSGPTGRRRFGPNCQARNGSSE